MTVTVWSALPGDPSHRGGLSFFSGAGVATVELFLGGARSRLEGGEVYQQFPRLGAALERMLRNTEVVMNTLELWCRTARAWSVNQCSPMAVSDPGFSK